MADSPIVPKDAHTLCPPASPKLVPERSFNPNGPGASRFYDNTSRIKAILRLPTIEEQIDAFARLRNCFMHESNSPSYPILLQYMSGESSLQETIDRIAEPIEELWRTGNHCAENGAEEDIEGYSWTSAVGTLMDLWYGVIHMAKRTPWMDETAQNKLIVLLQAFKARPAPTRSPEQQATVDRICPKYWDESEGMLWEGLPWYGLCAAEVLNDCPDGGSGCQIPEGIAFANLCGYQARLALAESVFEAWDYELNTLCLALDTDIEPHVADAVVPAAAVWVLVHREKLWEKCIRGVYSKKVPGQFYASWPGQRWVDKGKQITHFSKERWAFWKERFGIMASDEKLRVETSQIAGLVVEVMDTIEMGEDGKGHVVEV
jgi:hypothetical protein